MSAFHFKQFSIEQDKCAMKVSLDACVFGALCETHKAEHILDIGTGTGLLSLMLAQRSHAHIDAVELDELAAQQAIQNIDHSPFSKQIRVHTTDIKQFNSAKKYDLVVCNPPFFSDHLKGPDAKRNQARHNDGLSFGELSKSIATHLSKLGKVWILLPCSELDRFLKFAQQENLTLHQKWWLSSRPQKAPHRVIFTLIHTSTLVASAPDEQLTVHTESGPEYSADFKSLLCDYYLKLWTGRLFCRFSTTRIKPAWFANTMKYIAATSLLLTLVLAFFTGYLLEIKGNKTPGLASQSPSETPDFSAYTDVKQKKLDFFLFLLPKVKIANEGILQERRWLTQLPTNLNKDDQASLLALAKKYKVKTSETKDIIEQLLTRVDTIPASLVLAQAANESAWATSRFARKGNNLFGQWCYVKDCGLVPKQRGKGQNHEVAQFKSVQQSIESYMRNLNSQYSYEDLRTLRQQLRGSKQVVSGHQLAQGLLKYSTRREAYVEEIQAMIRQNGLAQYD